MKNKAVAHLVELIQLAEMNPLPLPVWVSVPGSLISGIIATFEDYADHVSSPFGERVSRPEGAEAVMWLHDVVLVTGGKTVYMPFCYVDLEQVAAWGVGLVS